MCRLRWLTFLAHHVCLCMLFSSHFLSAQFSPVCWLGPLSEILMFSYNAELCRFFGSLNDNNRHSRINLPCNCVTLSQCLLQQKTWSWFGVYRQSLVYDSCRERPIVMRGRVYRVGQKNWTIFTPRALRS